MRAKTISKDQLVLPGFEIDVRHAEAPAARKPRSVKKRADAAREPMVSMALTGTDARESAEAASAGA